MTSRAELAHRAGLTRARITQVMSLLDLAPEILKCIDRLKPTTQKTVLTERSLRDMARIPIPQDQVLEFEQIAGTTGAIWSAPPLPCHLQLDV